MQKLQEQIPLILLLVLSSYFFYSTPNLAQSIIITAITGLVGYRTYLDSLKKPDYVAIFKDRQDAKDVEINEIIRALAVQIDEVRDGQSKLAIVQNNKEKSQGFKW